MTTSTKPAKKTSAPKLTLAQLQIMVFELTAKVQELESRPARDRGPNSERQMTEEDARTILLGDMKIVSHKKVAEELKLSYGQVYSARNGFTFKKVYKEYRDSLK